LCTIHSQYVFVGSNSETGAVILLITGAVCPQRGLNVCHVWMFTGEKYLGVIKLQVICGGLCVMLQKSISFPLSIPR